MLRFHAQQRTVSDDSLELTPERCVTSLKGNLVIKSHLGHPRLHSEHGDADHRGEDRKPDHHFRGDGSALTR